MSLRHKPIDNIAESDLLALIDDKEPEGKEIEYKEQLPGSTDNDKKEFLADVCSFANCQGGDIVYGVAEERDENKHPTGVPAKVVGIDNVNLDQARQRLENLIREGIKPRLVGHSIRVVPLTNSGLALIVRIPRSWASPHMVTYQGSSKFYSRNSAGKYPLDVGEIRDAFLRTHALGEKLRAFRAERLGLIEPK